MELPGKTGLLLAERSVMSIGLALCLSVAIVFADAVLAGEAGHMDAAEIEKTFRGITLDGVYNDGEFYSETYFDDGTIRYHDAAGADSGTWFVRDSMFCTFYQGQQGACFFVVREGTNCFTFFEPMLGDDKTLEPREIWTSRGWNRNNRATCAEPPEAVI